MKKQKLFLLSGLASLAAVALMSCTKSSTADLQDAQLCLNKATAAEAMNCVSKIEGDSSPLAYSLRCSAIFISEGFGDASSFIDALDTLSNGNGCGGGCSPTVAALTTFRFANGDLLDPAVRTANNEKAAQAFSQCSQADAKIYTQIASLFQLGTMTSMLSAASNAGSMTESQLQTELQNGTLDPAIVGTIVSVTYSTTCTNLDGASQSTIDYCTEIGAAIQNGFTTTDIGSCIQKKLANPAAACP